MPTTADMCKEAILSLKDRTGSSRHAIKAYILAKYGKEPTPKALTAALSKDIFVKVKGSFKLTAEAKKPPAKPKKKKAPKKKAAPKKKKATKKKAPKKKATKKKAATKKPVKKATKKKPAKKKAATKKK
jgi:histone H1/5